MKKRILFFAMISTALTFSCQKAEIANNGATNNDTNNEVIDFVPGPGTKSTTSLLVPLSVAPLSASSAF